MCCYGGEIKAFSTAMEVKPLLFVEEKLTKSVRKPILYYPKKIFKSKISLTYVSLLYLSYGKNKNR
jgi:hypothetical protein